MEEHHRGKKDESTPMKRNCKASVYTDLHVSPFIGTYPCTIRTNSAVTFQSFLVCLWTTTGDVIWKTP